MARLYLRAMPAVSRVNGWDLRRAFDLARQIERKSHFRPFGHENDAGLGAELAGAEGEGSKRPLASAARSFAQRAGEHEDRIAAGHLSEAGDGMGTRSGEVHERAAAAERARESDGAD